MGDPTDEYLLGLVDEEDEKYAYSPSLRGGNDDAGQNQVEYVEETVPNWLQFTIAVGCRCVAPCCVYHQDNLLQNVYTQGEDFATMPTEQV